MTGAGQRENVVCPLSQRGIQLREFIRRADVRPETIESLAADPALGNPPLEVGQQFELRAARKFAEEAGIVEADVGKRLPRVPIEREPAVNQREITTDCLSDEVSDGRSDGRSLEIMRAHRPRATAR